MPDYQIKMPDGGTYKIGGPEGFTEQQAFETLQSKIKADYGHIAQGAAFGGGVLEGVPVIGPALKAAGQYTAAGLRSITPGGQPFSKELEAVQNIGRGVEKEYPTTTGAGQVTGGIAGGLGLAGMAPAAFGIGAPTVARGIGEAALGGGGIGLADAIARGMSPQQAAMQTGLGAAGGAAGPAIGAIGSRIVSPIMETARNFMSPGATALREVSGALQRDIGAGAASMSPQQFSAAQRGGMPVTTMDIGGQATRDLARSAANISADARNTLEKVIEPRFAQQQPRMRTWLEGQLNFPAANIPETIERTATQVNAPAYQKAFADGAKGMWSDKLEQLSGADSVTGAMQRAAKGYRDEAILRGAPTTSPPIEFNPDGSIRFQRGLTGTPTYPNLRYWDLVRRELSDEAQRVGYKTAEGRRLSGFADQLNNELDRLVPAYQEAREGAAMGFGAKNAYEAGVKMVGNTKMPTTQFRALAAKMNPLERKLFEDGYLSTFSTKVNKLSDRVDLVKRVFNSPEQRERLAIAVGPAKAKELEGNMLVETAMQASRSAIQGGSTTAKQLLRDFGFASGAGEAVNILGGSYDPRDIVNNPKALMTTMLLGGYRGARVFGQRQVANEVARLLTGSPQDLVRGFKLLAAQPDMMENLRKATLAAGAYATRATTETLPPLIAARANLRKAAKAAAMQALPTYGGPQE